MSVEAKICGVTDEDALLAAVDGGAAFVGFVFYPPSPRAIDAEEAAELAALLPKETASVALVVNPTDAELDALLMRFRPDWLQLHGDESPERVDAIRREYGVAVIKAVPVGGPADAAAASRYSDHADMLLFDAKPPADAVLPGGNAVAFNWADAKAYTGPLPWMLAGGLTAGTLADAVAASGAGIVDVSSGVERTRGRKDPALIAAFLEAAWAL